MTFHNGLALILWISNLRKKIKETGALQTSLLHVNFFNPKWITTMINSFTLQHTLLTWSCKYLNLPVLLNVRNDLDFVFGHMFDNFSRWHVLVWIIIIKINYKLIIFGSIYGNRHSSFFFFKMLVWCDWKIAKKMNANFRKWTLKLCLISKFDIITHVLPLIAHVLPPTTHVLPLAVQYSLLVYQLTSHPYYSP